MKKVLSAIMALTLVAAFAVIPAMATDGDVDVHGTIKLLEPTVEPGDPDNPGKDGNDRPYDVTYTATVYWWVTEETYNSTESASASSDVYNVVDGDANGPDATVTNGIRNNNQDEDIKVSLKAFTPLAGDAVTLGGSGDLDLFLTGDLANNSMGTTNIANGYTGTTTYTAVLAKDSRWSFGFTGLYRGTPTSTGLTPEYTMTLGFAWAA